MKKQVAYKIVHKTLRRGTNYILGTEGLDVVIPRKIEKYFPQYLKDAVVKAVPKSAGICCFKTREDAKQFINDELLRYISLCKILKVQGEGVVAHPVLYPQLGCNLQHFLDALYHRMEYDWTKALPDGFISFRKVTVLE